MKRWRVGAVMLCGVLAGLAAPALGQQALKLKFATLSQGTSWYQYGATMAEMLAKTMPGATISQPSSRRRR
ncbi:MAG TPA: hypothetical protein VED18_02660 [Candidatus Sulfotelmatobacter sp.]|nr:hypothetical protein [Candidatus Sulfotelmatobacter sp.]